MNHIALVYYQRIVCHFMDVLVYLFKDNSIRIHSSLVASSFMIIRHKAPVSIHMQVLCGYNFLNLFDQYLATR